MPAETKAMYDIACLELPPLRAAAGTVQLPGSKSISNRVLLLAGLARGTTVLHDLLDSDDTRVMLQALRVLGCQIVSRAAGATAVTGIGGVLGIHRASLFLGNAGTAMRPLTAALAVLSALQGGRFELRGVARMHERPIGDLVDAVRQLGCDIKCLGQDGYPPLRLTGTAGGQLRTEQPIRVRGDVSSQFLTALLLALPLASAERALVIEVDGELISKPYVEITLNLLQRFGIDVQRQGFERFTIPPGSHYRSPGDLHVEADASSASYFVALGAIAAAHEPVRIVGVGLDSIQGDIRFIEAARAMGALVDGGAGWLSVQRGAWPLQGLTLDCNHIPDAAMTLAVMALYASGSTRLNNIASWRVKETDRIAAMSIELRKVGAQVLEGADFIEITPPQTPGAWRPARFQTYDDHRMAMCLSLTAFNPAGLTMQILDPKCVAKTFPNYFETLFSVAQTDRADIPVITIDGPTASGKGTLAAAVAARLGWHQLDSGLLYRATALAALRQGLSHADAPTLAEIARTLDLRFDGERVLLAGVDVAAELRREDVGALASRVSAFAAVRSALNDVQWSFRRLPGLVADGRDMGSVIFPRAALKVFLTASPATRADRRHKQLISKGIPANLADLRADLEARDERDRNRAVSPLKPAEGAQLLDNSSQGIDESVDQVLEWWSARQPARRVITADG